MCDIESIRVAFPLNPPKKARSPSSALLPFFGGDYRIQSGTLILTFLLEDLVEQRPICFTQPRSCHFGGGDGHGGVGTGPEDRGAEGRGGVDRVGKGPSWWDQPALAH